MQISSYLLLIFLVLGGIASLQFYKGRKINTSIMIHYIRKFEENLSLRDKMYTYLGGYIGFKAKYDLQDKNIKRMELVLTLIPRQSLFWLPFSYPFKRGDRLYLMVYPKFNIRRDAHIVQNFYYLFGPNITEREHLKKEPASISRFNNYYTLYESKSDYDKLKKLIEDTFEDPRRVRHIALNRENNSLFILMKPDINATPKELKKLIENFPKVFDEWSYFKSEE
ncbi:hypothetical protein [Caldisericum exile]|uniref:Uncharacterized protein n=1 Tax=Caldisericum exile (strain DSM 21853 / NBRC 104410 / AZM16c01) TaxID=511051 RepID=A0A7U6GEA2_CALEA|nr:hypothetical protein [Caldisericum exile]BAL80712.1 hypothetical protein CSE_05860 [Caldisericum exile AZM16c01]